MVGIISLMLLLIVPINVEGCFNKSDLAAIEVVLNNPGVSYDITRLALMEGVKKIDYAYEAYAYKSHYDKHLVVIVSIQWITDKKEEYIAIRIQAPFEPRDNILKSAYSEEELKNALMTELRWLTSIDIIYIDNLEDVIHKIISSAKIGYAGWNNRLIFYNGAWRPFYEVVKQIGGVLLKSCGNYLSVPEGIGVPKAMQGKILTSTSTVILSTTEAAPIATPISEITSPERTVPLKITTPRPQYEKNSLALTSHVSQLEDVNVKNLATILIAIIISLISWIILRKM